MEPTGYLHADVISDCVIIYFGDGQHIILSEKQLRQTPTDLEIEETVRTFEEAQRDVP